ncbi:MAG: M56 family metallopeptidase [Sphingomonadaceae bacterium]|nr:M56 family metallopeptidase [Sphingomonadaceae bacterium]
MASNLVAVADSLGWTLLHSIWQVAILSALVFVALKITPRENPQLRFALAYLGMAGSALAFVVTFFVYYGAASGGSGAAASSVGWAAYLEMLGKMTWLISLLWSLGFAALGARYIQALRQTHKLRHAGVAVVPEKWEARFRLWLERLGGDPRASILYSDRVSTPVTIGTFKPVILVPIGFFTRLPSDQAEAVLVHEIAHICRQDYLLGLIQAMIANIFFFHPGIYYLSRQIDIEREYACDDRAARETGNAGPLAEALSRIAMQRDHEQLGFAMAADGPRTPIMDRINRLGRRPVSDRGTSTPMAALSLAFAASLMIAIGADASIAKTGDDGDSHDTADAETTKSGDEPRVRPAIASDSGKQHSEEWRLTADHEADISPRRSIDTGTDAECCDDDAPETSSARAQVSTFAISFDPSTFAANFMPSATKARGPARPAAFREPVARVRNAVHWEIDSEAEAECEDERAESRAEAARERAEHLAERAERIAERFAARAENIAESNAARHAARAERIAERYAARAERHAERYAERAERHAERIAERHAEKAERDAEERIEQRFEIERRNGRLTISVAPPQPPEAPVAPTVQTMSISVGPALIF